MTDRPPLQLRVVNDVGVAAQLLDEGWCPVECSIGGESFVDDLLMDHHGVHEHLEPVSTRAYRDHFGARRADPRFFTPAPVDADAAFATAALAGRLPHPDADVGPATPAVRRALTRDLSGLADTIARMDVEPIGTDPTNLEDGDLLLLWKAVLGNAVTDLGYTTAVGLWTSLTVQDPLRLDPILTAASEVEASRRNLARLDLKREVYADGPVVALAGTKVWGFDCWYRRDSDYPADTVEGWRNPCVFALGDTPAREITVGCPNEGVAKALFGPGGLRNVFPQLEPPGWGGRSVVGGSPRGQPMTEGQLVAAAKQARSMVVRSLDPEVAE